MQQNQGPLDPPQLSSAMLWVVLLGNLMIGCGMFLVPATLDGISTSLGESPAVTGQLISAAAATICVGTPIFSVLTARWPRRLLLTLAMVWFGVMHALSALAPDFSTLLVLRILTVVSSAVFTPQAAAYVGQIARPAKRSQVIAFVFTGWTFAAAFGIPVLAAIGGYFGWRWAFGCVAVLSLVVAALVWHVLPRHVANAPISLAQWILVFRHSLLMAMLCVTLLTSFAQHVLYSYIVVYYRQVLDFDTQTISLLLLWFGFCTLIGGLLTARIITRLGARRLHYITMSFIGLGLLLWPMGTGIWSALVVCTPWALAFFANNAAQQGRLAAIAPQLAGASIALNTSAIYFGHTLGAGIGGWTIANGHIQQLSWIGLGSIVCAITLARWLQSHRFAAEQSGD